MHLMRSPLAVARSVVQTLNLLGEVGASEIYRAQARRARDAKNATVFRQIQAHEATHACEARARVDSPESVRRAAEAAVRAGGGLLGTVTSLGGDRAALAFDLALERVFELGYRANLLLLPADARPSDRRVLKRALDEEREHQALLRDRLGI
jgi:demethoxyubiquinone hydroxylase (CLK1/Coq7/Cat5 family)